MQDHLPSTADDHPISANDKEEHSSASFSPTSVARIGQETVEPIVLSPPAKKWNKCQASQKAIRTVNPIRAIVDPIVQKIQSGLGRGDGKDHISLALGDPTVGGNLLACPDAIQAVVDAAQSKPHCAGYVNACGSPQARLAIAQYHSYHNHAISPENVIIANGCSGALELALTALLEPETILLVPQPGFPLYQVIVESHGAQVVHYRLDSETNWEIDIPFLENLVNQHGNKIRGILINNPSNPTGSVFSRRHLEHVLEFANEHQLPIVADEVYGELVFGISQFIPLAQLAAQHGKQVPVITASGLAKQFLLPGWRVGWIVFHDNVYGSLQEVESGAKKLAQVILGASHLPQSVIPTLLSSSTMVWRETLRNKLEKQAHFLCSKLDECHGLDVCAHPQGAMYAMVGINTSFLDIESDVDFSSKLLDEENVFVLPGSAFGATNVFRVVFCSDESVLGSAVERIEKFCKVHATH